MRYDPAPMPLEIVEMPDRFAFWPVEVAGRSFTQIPWIKVSAKGLPRVPYDAVLRIEQTGHGFVCTELEVKQRRPGGPPVTLAGLRSIPVEWIIQQCRGILLPESGEAALRIQEKATAGKTPLKWGGTLGLPMPARRRTGKRRTPEQEAEDVELAAVVYRLAEVCGLPPTKAVSDQLRIPLGTARFLVARAIKPYGFLEPRTKP